MSSGRYHHHIAANVWHSAGAGQRDPQRAGLSWFAFECFDERAFADAKEGLAKAGISVTETSGGLEAADPWQTRLRIVQG